MTITLNKKHKALLVLTLLVAVLGVLWFSYSAIIDTGHAGGAWLFKEVNADFQ